MAEITYFVVADVQGSDECVCCCGTLPMLVL